MQAISREKPEITHGIVYQPLTDESFWAEKGRGAWLQDQRLRVSARLAVVGRSSAFDRRWASACSWP